MKDLSMIACVSRDGGLGKNGELLWQIPADMSFFRKTTTDGTVIMGRKTFESIGRALPKRHNVVLSSKPVASEDIEWHHDENELRLFLNNTPGPKFIIGGASLYKMFLDDAEVIYLTEVDAEKSADTYFPDFDRSRYNIETLQVGDYNNISYRILKYTRRNENE